jgi:predicted O-methyltransferase YrrM
MISSYCASLNYGDIFTVLCKSVQPKTIAEFGILDGYSLKQMIENSDINCQINAYDIFDEFNGNGANKKKIVELFSSYQNVSICYGDFYETHKTMDNGSQDIVHIDIANNGEVYQFAFEHYLPKVSENGIMVLEGGSIERDNIEWMNKYNKPKIKPVLEANQHYKQCTIGTIPSITIIWK